MPNIALFVFYSLKVVAVIADSYHLGDFRVVDFITAKITVATADIIKVLLQFNFERLPEHSLPKHLILMKWGLDSSPQNHMLDRLDSILPDIWEDQLLQGNHLHKLRLSYCYKGRKFIIVTKLSPKCY